jgi:hypothetical protein
MEGVVKILRLLLNRCEYVVTEQFVRLFVHASRVVVGAGDHYRHIEGRSEGIGFDADCLSINIVGRPQDSCPQAAAGS